MAQTIAELLINIKANTAQLESALKRSEAQVQKLSKSASGAGIKNLDSELRILGRTAAAVALGMGGLSIGVTAAKTALEGTIQAAADDAASVARLKTAVENTGASYSDYSKQLEKVIENGQRLGFSDDQTRSSLALLSAQTGSVSEAMKRFSIAEDLARGANIDLETSSKLLGKVTEDNVRVLQRYGISIKQGASEAELFAAVQTKFAGQAETFADSTAGQFERTKIAISEAGESVGRILLPAVAQGAEFIGQMADAGNSLATAFEGLGQHTDVFAELARGAAAFVTALVAIKAFSLLPLAAQALTTALNFVRLAAAVRSVADAQAILALAGGSMTALVVAAVALAAAFVAVDLAVRHFTGGGLIDFLTGATEAHKRAAEAARSQGDALKELQLLEREGVAPEAAQRLEIEKQITNALKTQADLEKARADAAIQLANINQGNQRGRFPGGQRGIDLLTSGAQDKANAETEQQLKNIRALNLSYAQLKAVIDRVPKTLGDKLAGDLKDAEAAANAARKGILGVANAIDQLKEDASGLDTAISDFKSLFDAFDPATAKLKLQKAELEALKIKLGDAFSPQQQALLDGVTQRLSLASANAEVFGAKVDLLASAIRERFGNDVEGATGAIQKMTAALGRVPEEERIKLSVILPDLVKIASVWDRFIAALQAGASVTIAIRSAFIGANPPRNIPQGRANRGTGNEAEEPDVTAQVRGAIESAVGEFNNATSTFVGDAGAMSSAASGAGGAAKDAAAGMSYLERVLNASQDGMISLGEAVELNLTDAQVVALELAQAQNKVADAQFRQRIELQEMAALFPGLNEQQIRFNIALQQIAQNLQETGRTAEQFDLEERLRPALEKLASDFNALFNRPTRETAGITLRRDELERKRLLLLREGKTSDDPMVKALDAQIDALNQELALRQKDIDIMRDKNILADKTLLNDAAQAQQAALLTKAFGDMSGQVQTTSGVVYLQLTNLGNAANETADALRGIGGATGRAIGGPAGGMTWVGERGPELVRLPYGSNVYSNAQSAGMVGAGVNTFNITTYITADSKASQQSMQELADMVDERVSGRLRLAGFAAGAVNQNSFTPAGLR